MDKYKLYDDDSDGLLSFSELLKYSIQKGEEVIESINEEPYTIWELTYTTDFSQQVIFYENFIIVHTNIDKKLSITYKMNTNKIEHYSYVNNLHDYYGNIHVVSFANYVITFITETRDFQKSSRGYVSKKADTWTVLENFKDNFNIELTKI